MAAGAEAEIKSARDVSFAGRSPMTKDNYSTSSTRDDEPAPKPPPGDANEPRPQYFAALRYFFEHSDWARTLLLGSLCFLIPVIGTMLLFGYRYEIVEMKVRFPDQLYPRFDISRFSQYLVRGMIPFLIDFLIQFVINIPLQISIWMMIGLVATAGNSQSQLLVVIAGVGVPMIILVDIVLLTILQTVLVPVILRAGLCQDFGQTFKLHWIKDFLLKVGLQSLLFNLFLFAVGSVLVIPGYLACCFGIVPVMFFLLGPALAHQHAQLYRLYLARGGEPVPLKPLQMEPACMLPAPGPFPLKPPL
jgi:hypothetical protein